MTDPRGFELVGREREKLLKRSANRKYYREDFSGLDLSNADFRNATVTECNLQNVNLSYANMENANCWGSDFTGAILYRANFKDAVLANTKMHPKDCFGMTLTLTCDAVDRMQVSDKIMTMWLYMATMMKPETEETSSKIIEVIGKEHFEKLQGMFQTRHF